MTTVYIATVTTPDPDEGRVVSFDGVYASEAIALSHLCAFLAGSTPWEWNDPEPTAQQLADPAFVIAAYTDLFAEDTVEVNAVDVIDTPA